MGIFLQYLLTQLNITVIARFCDFIEAIFNALSVSPFQLGKT